MVTFFPEATDRPDTTADPVSDTKRPDGRPFVRDLSLLNDPKIASTMTPASKLKTKQEQLFLDSLYDNQLHPLNYATSIQITGDLTSTVEVGLHIVSTAIEKQHWSCVVDPRGNISSLAAFEAANTSFRFVMVRNFSPTRLLSVLSHLVSSMRIVLAHIPTTISTAHMARLMTRVRENNSILVLLDPSGTNVTACDRRIVATTDSFVGVDNGAGVLIDRRMVISEYEHGMKISRDTHKIELPNKRYA